jgi:[acyl-carrier-protein] S-malonyltransferase
MNKAGAVNPGAMAAVLGLDEGVIEMICRETGAYVANYNSPGQIVISGKAADVEAATRLASDKGARKVVPLQVSGAFHTPFMTPAAQGLALAVDRAPWQKPKIPVMANTTAKPITAVAAVKKELTEQLTHPVRWQQGVAALGAAGVDIFIEIGPGKVLSGLIKRILPDARTLNIGDAASLGEYIEKGPPA